MYFYICSHITAHIYTWPFDSEEEIIARIAEATTTTRQQPGNFGRTRQCLLRRCQLCIEVGSRKFELLVQIDIETQLIFQNTLVILLDFQP
jgi:hypothetical protein